MTFRGFLHHLNRRDTRLFPKISFNQLILIFVFLSVAFSVKALSQSSNTLQDFQKANRQGTNQEAWLKNAFDSNIASGINTLTGEIPDGVFNGSVTSWVPGGAIGSANYLMASLYTPAASGIEYVAQTWGNFLGKPAYAQGFGFTGLQPILPLWRSFRNIVYLLFSLTFVIIGIMIILRVKISPQAVINVQNALPQLITSLILITFSYAIAGLLIDLSTFIQSLVIGLLFAGNQTNLSESLFPPGSSFSLLKDWLQNIITGGNFHTFNYTDLVSNNGFFQTFGLFARVVPLAVLVIPAFAIGGIIGGIFGSPLPGIGPVVGAVLGGSAISILILLILLIIILFTIIGFTFSLIKCYITIIFKIILAPIEIGLGSFPNSKVGFNSWIMDIIANLAVFPISLIYLVLLNIIVDKTKAGLWTPAMLGTVGYIASLTNLTSALIGIGGLIIFSKLPTMIPEFIFMIKPSPWGKAIGQSLEGPTKLLKATGQQAIHDQMGSRYGSGTQDLRGRAGKFGANIFELLGWARKN